MVRPSDRVDDLNGLLFLAGNSAADLGDLRGSGKLDPDRGRGGLDGTVNTAAVSGLGYRMGGNVFPEQSFAGRIKGLLIGFDAQDVVGSGGGDPSRGFGLGVHGIQGHHRTGQNLSLVKDGE